MGNESVISKILKGDIPTPLFHYVSSEGLRGIITTGKIWTTEIHYLNDKSEQQLAFGYIRDEISRQKKVLNKSEPSKNLIICLKP